MNDLVVSLIITISLCNFSNGGQSTQSYVLRVGMSRYSNEESIKQDGTKCDKLKGVKSHCDIKIIINCTTCPASKTIAYPNSLGAYKDTRRLVLSDFEFKTLAFPVKLTDDDEAAEVTLEVTIVDVDKDKSELIFNRNVTFNFNIETVAMAWKERLLPFASKIKNRALNKLNKVALRYAIDCAPGTCGDYCENKECTRTNVCTDKNYTHCQGHFEYRVKLIDYATDLATSENCMEFPYACIDSKCLEKRPLLRYSPVEPNKTIRKYSNISDVLLKVNETVLTVEMGLQVVIECNGTMTSKFYDVGSLEKFTTKWFFIDDKHRSSIGLMHFGCQAGYTGPFCRERCDDCIVDQWLCAESNCLSRVFAPESLCTQNTCWNDGICTVKPAKAIAYGIYSEYTFMCECKPGYSGQFCELKRGEVCSHKYCHWFQYCSQSYLEDDKNGFFANCECTFGIDKRLAELYDDDNCVRFRNGTVYLVSVKHIYSERSWLFQMCQSANYSCHTLHTLCIEKKCKVFLEEIGKEKVFPKNSDLSYRAHLSNETVSNLRLSIKVRVLITQLGNGTYDTTSNLPTRSLYKRLRQNLFVMKNTSSHVLYNITDTEVGYYSVRVQKTFQRV